MSKVATYLRNHIDGPVFTRSDWRASVKSDAGILSADPDMVVIPDSSDDIRKLARFAWQMAEKGHNIPLITRGGGRGALGGAVGHGIVLNMAPQLNRIFEYEPKAQLVRVQPGAPAQAVTAALSLQGSGIGPLVGQAGTVAGIVAAGSRGSLMSRETNISEVIDQLEVVLANGDILQTQRLSRRELQRRKDLHTMEGEIYRKLDEIIVDNQTLIDRLDSNDISGYGSIKHVKRRDGSFDLGPLFVGSEGTLGIIDELILKTEFLSFQQTAQALVFRDGQEARLAIDDLDKLQPARLEYIDARIFEQLHQEGKAYRFYEEAAQEFTPSVVILVTFDDFNKRTRTRKRNKVEQIQSRGGVVVYTVYDDKDDNDIQAALDILTHYRWPDNAHIAAPRLFDGFYVPPQQLEGFVQELPLLEQALHMMLPLAGQPGINLYGLYPRISLRKISDKQKIFKLYDELSKLLVRYDGCLVASGGEGRLKTRFARINQDPDTVALYQDIKRLFDPYNILNPDNKTALQARTITAMLRDEYTTMYN